MLKSAHTSTAKIYAFPKGGRSGVVAQVKPETMEQIAARATRVSYDSWYHEAALQDDAKRD